MEEHDAYERELAYSMEELRLSLSSRLGLQRDSQRDSEDGQEDLSIGAPSGGGGGGPLATPLLMVQIDATTIAFHYGTVNSIVPTISGTPLDPDVSLNTITVSANNTYWLDATLVSGAITAVAIVSSNPGADTATQTKQVIGSVTWDGGGVAIDAVASNLTGSQNVDSCGATHSWNLI